MEQENDQERKEIDWEDWSSLPEECEEQDLVDINKTRVKKDIYIGFYYKFDTYKFSFAGYFSDAKNADWYKTKFYPIRYKRSSDGKKFVLLKEFIPKKLDDIITAIKGFGNTK